MTASSLRFSDLQIAIQGFDGEVVDSASTKKESSRISRSLGQIRSFAPACKRAARKGIVTSLLEGTWVRHAPKKVTALSRQPAYPWADVSRPGIGLRNCLTGKGIVTLWESRLP